MGSLPNLNELCRERAQRREVERVRDLARERVREREFSRGDKEKGERLPNFPQVRIITINTINRLYFPTVPTLIKTNYM